MDIAGHNLSNVNTIGYTRQAIEFGTAQPTTIYTGQQFQLGNGVSITSINRIRDQFLDSRMLGAQGEMGRYQSLATSIQQVESTFNEPGPNGIGVALDRFFNAFSGLASNPNESGARLEAQQAGQMLAGRIQGTYQNLQQHSSMIGTQIQQTIQEIDQLSSTIAALNVEIRRQASAGSVPNDLLDQRDNAVEALSRLVNINTTPGDNLEITVHFGGYPLVDTSGSHAIPPSFDATTFKLSDGTYNFDVRSGKLYGLFELTNKIQEYKTSLDTLANTLRSEVNTIHKSGLNPNATTDIPFFTENAVDPQNGAVDFDLSAQVKADVNNISTSITGTAGDGGLALSISNLKTSSPLLGGKSYTRWYSDFIGGIGRDTATVIEGLTTQSAVTQQVEAQRQSVVGVSIDDEMAQMLKFQKSYQAAARVLSVFDQMTEDLIAMVR
jgi:flagellar hook-associated protein 1 FlgK